MGDNYPRVTPEQVGDARRDQLRQFFAAVGFGAATTTAYSLANAPGGFFPRKFVGGFSGVEVKPQPGRSFGPGVATVPRLGIPLLFAPQPVGFIPAEFYGLKPNVVQDTLGFRMGSKPPWLNPAPDRVTVFDAAQQADAIVSRAVGPTSGHVTYGPERSPFRPGTVRVSQYELDWLRSLPAGVSDRAKIFLRDIDSGRLRVLPTEIPVRPYGPSGTQAPVFTVGTARDLVPADIEGHLHVIEDARGNTAEVIEASPGVLVPIDARGVAIGTH